MPTWRDREAARLTDGTYEPVPWQGARWFMDAMASNPALLDHYVHRSKAEPGKVAFTESESHGIADRQTRMKPGRYLTRYFSDYLNSVAIEELARGFLSEGNPQNCESKSGVLFATTPEDIEYIYTEGKYLKGRDSYGSSCMAHSRQHFESSVHPASIYGAGDLACAYMLSENREITARTICWPAKKIYMRIYALDDTYDSLLMNALQQLGYSLNRHGFDGARLLRIEDDYGLVCPYLDTSDKTVRDNGEYLIIDGAGEINANTLNGLVECEESYCCDRCEERCNEVNTVYTNDGREEWCEDCYCAHASRCDSCEEAHANVTEVQSSRYRRSTIYLCSECYSEQDYHECADCGEHSDTCSEAPDYEYYCADCYGNHTASCHACDDEHMIADLIEVGDVLLCKTCEPTHAPAILDGPGAGQLALEIAA